MAKSEKIRVMLSSRCKARISYKNKPALLSNVRENLQEEINSLVLWKGQKPLFECWINETDAGGDIDQTWWDESINQSKDADVAIVFYNGEAGSGIKNGPIGVCHAELEEILRDSKKVRIIRLPLADLPTGKSQLGRDQAFRAYLEKLDPYAQPVKTGEQLIEQVRLELRDLVVDLVQKAAITPDLSKSNTGPALAWHRMSYAERELAMREEMQQVLAKSEGSQLAKKNFSAGEWITMWLVLGGKRILTVLHAVPAGLSQPAAREIVGQPFLMDYKIYDQLAAGDGGPLHLVACYKGATESQALKMLGFPDATVVPGRFGLHVADAVQKIQIVLLKNCQSPHATQNAISTWLEWLNRSDEDIEVAKRAVARKRIIDAIAEVNGIE